jgi:DNA polymerase III delta prime subunit
MRLFEISEQLERIIFDSTDENGEISDEGLEAITEIEGELKQKATNVALYVLGEIAEAKAVDEHVKRLQERVRSHKKRAEKLKKYLEHTLLHDLGQEVIDDPRVKIAWRKSQAVVVDEDAALPPELTRVKVEPDKVAIKERLKSGLEIDGCELEDRVSMVLK